MVSFYSLDMGSLFGLLSFLFEIPFPVIISIEKEYFIRRAWNHEKGESSGTKWFSWRAGCGIMISVHCAMSRRVIKIRICAPLEVGRHVLEFTPGLYAPKIQYSYRGRLFKMTCFTLDLSGVSTPRFIWFILCLCFNYYRAC